MHTPQLRSDVHYVQCPEYCKPPVQSTLSHLSRVMYTPQLRSDVHYVQAMYEEKPPSQAHKF
eukprot:scaffold24679_cov193-Skeletonema_marinoi.AAC.1